jgi:hypothetical protein
VSNFLKNLARRSAGLPLAAECRPTPSPAFESSLEAGEGLNEITSEETHTNALEAAPARESRIVNTSAPEVQRSSPESTGTSTREITAVKARTPSAPDTTTILQPAASLEVVSAKEITPPFRGEAETSARLAGDTVAQFVTRDSELTPRAASAHAQTPPAALPPLSPAVNPPETTSRLPEEQESTWPEVTVKAIRETVHDKLELIATDHLIRPAATESTASFQFPAIASASPQPAPATPIQVRIGRVEVRGAPPVHESPTQATPKESPPLGFASYHRLRRYRY